MSQNENQKLVESGKILGSMYGSLIIFFAVLFFLGFMAFSSLPSWAAERSFILIWSVGVFIVILGAELGRVLFKSGVTVVGFFGLLALNLLMIVIGLAVYVDVVLPTASDVTIQWVLVLLVATIVWYFVLCLLLFRERRRG